MRSYRNMTRVHCLPRFHRRSANNPGDAASVAELPAGQYAYRTAACGQVAYCREVGTEDGGQYQDQFGPVPFVSWTQPELVTCKTCQKAMRK